MHMDQAGAASEGLVLVQWVQGCSSTWQRISATSAQEGPLALFNGWLPTYFRRAHETRTLAFRAASPHSHCAVRPPPLPCLVSHGGAP